MKKHNIVKEIFETYGFVGIEVIEGDLHSPKLKAIMSKWGIKMCDTSRGSSIPIIKFWGNHYSLTKLFTLAPISHGNKSEDLEYLKERFVSQESRLFKPYQKI